MGKIAVMLIAFSFILTSCGAGSNTGTDTQVVQKMNANYFDYSADAVKNTQGNKVLFFHADWCGTCKSVSKKIEQAQTSVGLSVFKVDYDSNADLRKMYDVTSQHTFVQVDGDGQMLAKWTGSKNLQDIQANIVETIIEEAMTEEVAIPEVVTEEAMTEEVATPEVVTEETMTEETMTEEVATQEAMTDEVMMDEGSFVDYSEEQIAKTKGNKVLFFHADWCTACTTAAKNLSAETGPEGLTVFKVDYDSNDDVKARYGITTQHTFVQIDNKGIMVKRWFGSRNYTDILTELQS